MSGILARVILTVPDAGLAALLASPAALSNAWSAAWEDVKVFLQVLRKSASLAHALALGMVELVAPSTEIPPGQVTLADGPIVLSAMAADEAGGAVLAPHLAPASVRRLAVTEVTVGGHSGFRLAG